MRTSENNNNETKTTNTQLRRSTMNATKLTMIAFAAAAIVMGGCSSDNRITGPGNAVVPEIDKDLVEYTTSVETENNAARIAVRGNESAVEHLTIIAEVFRTNVEKGCWYLTSESGDNYTPVTPKSLSLELGMKLKANGYIDKNIHFFCGNGPAFVIEEYEVLNEWKDVSEDRASKDEATGELSEAAAEDRAPEKKAQERKPQLSSGEKAPASVSEDRAPKNEATGEITEEAAADAAREIKIQDRFEYAPSEDRAPEKKAQERKPQLSSGEKAPASVSEDRAPKNEATGEITEEAAGDAAREIKIQDRFEYAPSEDRAPEKKAQERKPQLSSGEKAPASLSEDRAPRNEATGELSEAATEDRAPEKKAQVRKPQLSSGEKAPASLSEDHATQGASEDKAPKQYEDKKEAEKFQFKMASPVPVISEDMQFNSSQAVNALEGYVRYAKEGCLLLETLQKKVFELHHDMDVILKDDMHIRVFGYISALLYMTCSDAPVFYAERMEILSDTKEQKNASNDAFASSQDAYIPEVIEAEGTMHRTEPEGMCWYFETDEKDRYELIFTNSINLRSGMRLKIKATPADVSTFCDTGKPVMVLGWETVNENKF